MVGVSTSVNLPLHHKVQKFSSGTGSPGWSHKKGRKTVVVVFHAHFVLCFYTKLLWYGNSVDNISEEHSGFFWNALVAVSKGMPAVKLHDPKNSPIFNWGTG